MNSQHPPRLTDFTYVDVTVEHMEAGGFGLVFMGPDRLHNNQWYALKTLRPELLSLRPQLRDLFLQECLTWVGLWPHPNLLTAQCATQIDGRLFLVVSYAEHGSLRGLLTLEQPFLWRLRWAQHIAAGLDVLHTPDPEFLRPHSLLHRDLKPENILVGEQGYAKITDFGLAATIGDALAQSPDALTAFAPASKLVEHGAQGMQSPHATRAIHTTRFHTRTVNLGLGGGISGLGGVGTIQYMPPEQWDTSGKVGASADLYAFGLILSELLAGRHGLADLEANLSEDSWYQLHLSGTPRPLRSGPAEGASRLPIEIEQLYLALLAKRPADRPTAAEALSILQQAAQKLGEEPYDPPFYPRTDENRRLAWSNWAVTCARFGRLEEALTRNQQALNLDHDNIDALIAQGNTVADLGIRTRQEGRMEDGDRLLEEALDWYDQAIAVAATDANRAVAQGMKAARLNELGRHAEAEAGYAAALALVPEHGGLWYNRANNELKWALVESTTRGRAEAQRLFMLAETYAQQAVHLRPNHSGSRTLLADIQHDRARLGA